MWFEGCQVYETSFHAFAFMAEGPLHHTSSFAALGDWKRIDAALLNFVETLGTMAWRTLDRSLHPNGSTCWGHQAKNMFTWDTLVCTLKSSLPWEGAKTTTRRTPAMQKDTNILFSSIVHQAGPRSAPTPSRLGCAPMFNNPGALYSKLILSNCHKKQLPLHLLTFPLPVADLLAKEGSTASVAWASSSRVADIRSSHAGDAGRQCP